MRQYYLFLTILLTLLSFGCNSDYSNWTNEGLAIKWPNHTAQVRLSNASLPSGSEEYQRVVDAANFWNNVGASDWNVTYSSGTADPNNHSDNINYATFLDQSAFDPGLNALVWIRANENDLQEVDVWFNEEGAYSRGWNTLTNPDQDTLADPASNGYSFYLAATRALGFVAGLADYEEDLSIMNFPYPWGGTFAQNNSVGLHASERGGIRKMYPGSGNYTDLALANYYNVDDDYA